MKKNKILLPAAGVVSLAGAIAPFATGCGCTTSGAKLTVQKDENINEVTTSLIKLNEKLTIVVSCKDGFELKSCMIKVGETALSSSDFTINGNIIVVKAEAMKSLEVAINVTSKELPVVTPEVTLLTEAQKEIDVKTYEEAPYNYLFETNDIKSLAGLIVKVKNLKIDGTPYDAPSNIVDWVMNSEGYIRVDFNILSVFNLYTILTDSTVTFDLQFVNTETGLNTTIQSFKINVIDEEKPVEEKALEFTEENYNINNSSQGCLHSYWTLDMASWICNVPKVLEMLGITTLEIGNVEQPTGSEKPVLVSLYKNYYYDPNNYATTINMPSCVTKTVLKNDKAPSTYLWMGGNGTKIIDLGKDITTQSKVILAGGWSGMYYEKSSLSDSTNLEELIFSKRGVTISTKKVDSTSYGVSPFIGCPNLKKMDVSCYTTVEEINELCVFEYEDGGTMIFDRSTAGSETHAEQGTIIIPKNASNDIKNAWTTKFGNAGLTIDGTNWKFVEAEA